MADLRPRSTNVPKGLETTRDTSSSRLAWTQYLNSRTAEDSDARRAGMVRLHRFAAPSSMVDFDGTDDDMDIPTSDLLNALGLVWTVETLFNTDDISSNRFVLGRRSAAGAPMTIVHNTSSEVIVTVLDTGAASDTLTWTGIAAGTTCALQVTRSGTTLTGYLNGVAKTATMSATLSVVNVPLTIGSDNNGSFYDGRIDFFRVMRYAKAHRHDAWARLVNPRVAGVVCDYVFLPDSNSYIVDRSSSGAHGAINGSPTSNVAPLAVNPVPVLGIASNLSNDFAQKAYIRAAGALYPAVVK